ncbi:transposase [Nocardia sp. NPDC050712]|uniref:transposase n=1 Tax=Nocardia sp. NPDC050712 TaxID=3155518 RepID=UPI0033C4719E
MPKRYSEQVRRKVLAMVETGRPVARVSADLGIAEQTIYNWRRQELIASGRALLTRTELSELLAARQRISELEQELSQLRKPHAPHIRTSHPGSFRVALPWNTVLVSEELARAGYDDA